MNLLGLGGGVLVGATLILLCLLTKLVHYLLEYTLTLRRFNGLLRVLILRTGRCGQCGRGDAGTPTVPFLLDNSQN